MAGVQPRRAQGHADQRQPHDEAAAAVGAVAGGVHRAAVHLDQPLDQRQADAQAALRAFARAVGLREQVEHARQHVGRQADARVLHHDHRVVAIALGQHLDVAALGRVLGRVVQQVGHDLAQPRRVGVHHQRARRREPRREVVAAGVDQRAAGLDRGADGVGHVDLLAPQFDLALADAADVEQVVDQVHHLPQLALDDLARVVVHRLVARELHDLHRVADRCERVAQLVRERGEELVLAQVGIVQRGLGVLAQRDVRDDAQEAQPGRLGHAGARRDVRTAVDVDPVLAAVGPDRAGLEGEVGARVERLRDERPHALAVVRMQVREQRLQAPVGRGPVVAEAAVEQLGMPAFAGRHVDLPFAHVRRGQRELEARLALAQRGVDQFLLGDVGRDREHRFDLAVLGELRDQAGGERPGVAALPRVVELEGAHFAAREDLADGALPVGLQSRRHADLGARAADVGGRRHAAVAFDDRAHVEIAQVAIDAREDVRRVLHQRGELALAPGQRRSGRGQCRLGLDAVVDVADHGQRAQRRVRRVLQQRDGALDMHLAAIAAHVHRLRPVAALRAQRLARVQRAPRVGPALAQQVRARPPKHLRRRAAVLPFGRRVHEDDVVVDVEREHRVLHLRENVLAHRVGGRVGAVQRVDVLADDQRVDVAVTDGCERVLGLDQARLELDVGAPQPRQLVVGRAASGAGVAIELVLAHGLVPAGRVPSARPGRRVPSGRVPRPTCRR